MTTLHQLVKSQFNPFDQATFKPGNFWQETPDLTLEVDSIHADVVTQIENTLSRIAKNHATRTLVLTGEAGSGKSYLLGRIKRRLNDRAYFAYIGPWPDREYVWRHTLRNTVDSLMYRPDGQDKSQLLLWLEGLIGNQHQGLSARVWGERGQFIRNLQAAYPAEIYNGKAFFGVLYDLATNPDLRSLAYGWLKGDNLDEEDLKALRVKQSINSEDAAQKLLKNLGRVARSTRPIVLCFDNLDSIPKGPNGRPDFQGLFNLNSTFHNEKLNNFLVLISVVRSTWETSRKTIQPADLDRVEAILKLKRITLDQAAALWALRLAPLHSQLHNAPASAIEPLSRAWLEHQFQGQRVLPRMALKLGRWLMDHYKRHGQLPEFELKPTPPPGDDSGAPLPPIRTNNGGGGSPPGIIEPIKTNIHAAFQLVWQQELQQVERRLTSINQLTSPDLIWRLREGLEALGLPVRERILTGKFAAYSLAQSQDSITTAIVWNEDPNMTTFFHVMNACQKAVKESRCQRLYLIRAGQLGRPRSKGQQLYQQYFGSAVGHRHFKPDLLSLQRLEAYHQLACAARGRELSVGSHHPNLGELQQWVRQSNVLQPCALLQELQVVQAGERLPAKSMLQDQVREYVLSVMVTQSFVGLIKLTDQVQQQFPKVESSVIEQVITLLCTEGKLQIPDLHATKIEQLVYHVP